jgi:hypothetical protein
VEGFGQLNICQVGRSGRESGEKHSGGAALLEVKKEEKKNAFDRL